MWDLTTEGLGELTRVTEMSQNRTGVQHQGVKGLGLEGPWPGFTAKLGQVAVLAAKTQGEQMRWRLWVNLATTQQPARTAGGRSQGEVWS